MGLIYTYRFTEFLDELKNEKKNLDNEIPKNFLK